MMTSFAALLGGLPLALEGGTGSELRKPLGGQHRGRVADQPGADPATPPRGSTCTWSASAGGSPRAGIRGRRAPRRKGLPGEPGRKERPVGASGPGGAGGTVLTRGAASISEPFIRRPIGTSLLAAAIILLGASAYTQLPVAPLPRVDLPTITVNASLVFIIIIIFFGIVSQSFPL